MKEDPWFQLFDQYTGEYFFYPEGRRRIEEKIWDIVCEITDEDNEWMVAHRSNFLKNIGLDPRRIKGTAGSWEIISEDEIATLED